MEKNKYHSWLRRHSKSLQVTIDRMELALHRLKSGLEKVDQFNTTSVKPDLIRGYENAIQAQQQTLASVKLLKEQAEKRLKRFEQRRS